MDIKKYLEDLEKIVNIDSGSDSVDGAWEIAKFFIGRFEAAGYSTTAEQVGPDCRPIVIAKTKGFDEFSFYLGGHFDTVFPKGTALERPFSFDGEIAYGPGTVDMKGGCLLILHLAEYMAANHPEVPLSIVLNSDEEIGSIYSADVLRREGGLCRQALIFEGGRKHGQFVSQRKGISKYRITIKGKASHSGTAHRQGVSAILELSKWIVRLDKLNNYDRGTTVNVGLISGGTALNMVAPIANATMEVRYTQERELKRVNNCLKKLVQSPFAEGISAEVEQLSHCLPLTETVPTLELMSKLKKYELTYVHAGGISDANRLAPLGIPIIDGCGPSGGFPHNEMEFLRIETVESRFSLLSKILADETL